LTQPRDSSECPGQRPTRSDYPIRNPRGQGLTASSPSPRPDITHRAHAICEQVWADLIDGPWAHQPSGSFAANAAWSVLAAITHNLLRAAGTLTGTARHAVARGATLRRELVNVPARLARPQRRPVPHLPAHWPKAKPWHGLWTAVFTT
jgi:hypothetical protein